MNQDINKRFVRNSLYVLWARCDGVQSLQTPHKALFVIWKEANKQLIQTKRFIEKGNTLLVESKNNTPLNLKALGIKMDSGTGVK